MALFSPSLTDAGLDDGGWRNPELEVAAEELIGSYDLPSDQGDREQRPDTFEAEAGSLDFGTGDLFSSDLYRPPEPPASDLFGVTAPESPGADPFSGWMYNPAPLFDASESRPTRAGRYIPGGDAANLASMMLPESSGIGLAPATWQRARGPNGQTVDQELDTYFAQHRATAADVWPAFERMARESRQRGDTSNADWLGALTVGARNRAVRTSPHTALPPGGGDQAPGAAPAPGTALGNRAVRGTVDETGAGLVAARNRAVPGTALSVRGGRQDADPLRQMAWDAAVAAGIDPFLFVAQIDQESQFVPTARNQSSGAAGIAQFMPATAAGFGIDPMDPAAALPAAARYMRQLLDTYGGDEALALAAYNAGPGTVAAAGGVVPQNAETPGYVSGILAARQRAQDTFEPVRNELYAAPSAGTLHQLRETEQFGRRKASLIGSIMPELDRAELAAQRPQVYGNPELTPAEQEAWCGPAAAMAFARRYGREPTYAEMRKLATLAGWNSQDGMARGPAGEVELLKRVGVSASVDVPDERRIVLDVTAGRPVAISTGPQNGGHYFYATDVRRRSDGAYELDFGTSVSDINVRRTGGRRWWTLAELPTIGFGSPRAAIYVDPKQGRI